MYRYVQQADANGNPLPFTGALWRWAPVASAGNTPPALSQPIHPGAVAAFVIGILLSIFNAVLLVALARNQGALPDSLMSCFGFCGGASAGGYKRPSQAPVDGFYSSSAASGASGADAMYLPPPA